MAADGGASDSSSFGEIIVGTYEHLIVGYKIIKNETEITFEQSFTNNSHCGSIRSVTSTPKYLVSGSTDEMIKIFNLNKRVEVGSLMEQEGNITCLEFFKNSFLFSGSEDGTVCIWNVRNWTCEKILRGHKKGVSSIAVHPSGKLALSLSKDHTLRTWNLIKGRSAYITNLKAVGEVVRWSPDGNFYAITKISTVDIFKVETAGIVQTIDFGKQILAAEFVDEKHICLGGEGGNIEIYAFERSAIVNVVQAHNSRIKCLSCVKSPLDANSSWIVSASSDGTIKIWQLQATKLDLKPQLVAQVDSKCRITCMTVALSKRSKKTEIVAEEAVTETEEPVDEVSEQPKKKLRFEGVSTKKKRIKSTARSN